jgi:hypothetical protein
VEGSHLDNTPESPDKFDNVNTKGVRGVAGVQERSQEPESRMRWVVRGTVKWLPVKSDVDDPRFDRSTAF